MPHVGMASEPPSEGMGPVPTLQAWRSPSLGLPGGPLLHEGSWMFAIRFAVCAREFLRSLSAQRRLHEQAMGPQGGKAREKV